MGLFKQVFHKTWLVQAHDVRGHEFLGATFKKIFDAPDRETAEGMMRRYLTEEQFQFGKIEAMFG